MLDKTTPIPRRFWWLKRLAILCAALLLLVVGLRWYWGYVMSSRLNAAVAAIRERGEPIELSDLVTPTIPDRNNRAYYLREALAQWPRVNGQLIDQADWHIQRDQYDDPIDDDAAYLKQCEQVFALLRETQQATECDWGITLTSPAINIWLPQLGNMRQLARLVDDAAERAHRHGNDQLALELIRYQFTIADGVEVLQHRAVCHLVAYSIRLMVLGRLEAMSHSLKISSTESSAVQSEQVLELTSRLLDNQVFQHDFVHAVVGERLITHDVASAIIDGRFAINNYPGGPLIQSFYLQTSLLSKPILRYDELLMLEIYEAAIVAARNANTYPEYQQVFRNLAPNLQVIDDWPLFYPLFQEFFPVEMLDMMAHANFHQQTHQQMAAIALAIRLYQIDHAGRRPATLDELVPDYLDAVPNDVFATTDRPIGYKPGGVVPIIDRGWQYSRTTPNSATSHEAPTTMPAEIDEPRLAILYSVGADGEDDGGMILLEKDGDWSIADRSGDLADICFLLDPKPQPKSEQESSEDTAKADDAN